MVKKLRTYSRDQPCRLFAMVGIGVLCDRLLPVKALTIYPHVQRPSTAGGSILIMLANHGTQEGQEGIKPTANRLKKHHESTFGLKV